MNYKYLQTAFVQWLSDKEGVDVVKSGTSLKKEFAKKALIIYDDLREAALRHDACTVTRLTNALSSDHIWFNFFLPMNFIDNKPMTTAFFNDLLGVDYIEHVKKIQFDFRPVDRNRHLGDGSCWDLFVPYLHKDGSTGGIGIELKYTETKTNMNDSEYQHTHNEEGYVDLYPLYAKPTCDSGYYLPGVEEELVSIEHHQMWRQHILGASMIANREIQHFTSVLLYPEGNTFFTYAGEDYKKCLTEKGKESFKLVTYEMFLDTLAKHFTGAGHKEWIEYLNVRYIARNVTL